MENNTKNAPNTMEIINLVLIVVVLVLGLTGSFAAPAGGALSQDDVEQAVTNALEDFDFPTTAAAPSAPSAAAPAPAPAATTLDTDELVAFYEDSYVYGPEDAKVTIIEFSDFECPFCKRHETQGTLQQVMEKYDGDVNVVFSHFPLNFHPLAQKAGEASECVGEQGGDDAFYAFKKAIFAEAKPTREAITKVVEGLEGIDAAAVETCIDEGKYAQKVTDMMAFGRKLGVTGTPGNIVMNNESGDYEKVSGAVPATAFDTVVSKYLN